MILFPHVTNFYSHTSPNRCDIPYIDAFASATVDAVRRCDYLQPASRYTSLIYGFENPCPFSITQGKPINV